jgi:outer membrane protein TolC
MNNQYKPLLLIAVILLCVSFRSFGQQAFTLEQIITRAKGNSPAAKREETRKENRYWQYRYFKSNYNPQLRLQGTLPVYYKSVRQIQQQDGTFKYLPVEQTNNGVALGLEQPIPWTGGTISANTSLNYFRDFNAEQAFAEQWSGTVMNVALSQPLFSFNSLRWDRMTEPLRYEESKRDYVEQMEAIAREAANMFFNVLQAQVALQIARFNLANNDTIFKIEQGRYNIGTTSKDKLLQVELQLLRSRQGVSEANLALETTRLQLRSFIGLNDGESFELVLPEEIPQFQVTVDEALDFAKKNRADYVSFQRRRIEAERDVAEAKGRRYPTTLTAAYGLNNNGVMMGDVYQNPLQQQQFNLAFSVPVLDWGRNKSLLKTAVANKKLNDFVIAQEEVNFEQEIMTKVRQFEMLKLQIEITKKSDEVAAERYNVAQNRYLIGKIDITDLNIALNEKDQAKTSYISSLQSFWTAYYDLRALTLYDFANRQLLYTPEN